jgi:hypothetical protein
MTSAIEAQLLLCDHAVTDPTGKVHMLGAGWTLTPSPTAPHGVAVLLKVPWERANEQLKVTLQLLTASGDLTGPTTSGDGTRTPIEVNVDLEVGRPPGVTAGSQLPAVFALNVGPIDLPLGRYGWRLQVAETELTAWFEVTDKLPR